MMPENGVNSKRALYDDACVEADAGVELSPEGIASGGSIVSMPEGFGLIRGEASLDGDSKIGPVGVPTRVVPASGLASSTSDLVRLDMCYFSGFIS